MNDYIDTTLVDKAINYAVLHHKNTRRRNKNFPYIIHPLEAMAIVSSITDDNELIAAAALHDLIEDTDVTYDDLKNEFGERIAKIVLSESITEIPNYKEMTWVQAKQYNIDELKRSSLDVKIIALGDKLSNLRAINNDFKRVGMELWQRFHEKDPKLHKWRFNELLNCFGGLEDTNAYKEFKRLVEETFSGV